MQLIVKELVRQGIKVTVVATQYPFSEEKYEWFNTTVYPLNGKNSKISSLLNSKRKLKRTINHIHNIDPIDVIHGFWLLKSSYDCIAISQQMKLPLVLSAFGQDVLPKNRFLNRIMDSSVKVITTSEFQKNILKECAKDISVIPLGVEQVELTDKSIDCIGVGSLIDLKNYDYFLNLIQGVKQSIPSIKCVLIGEGPKRSELELKVIRLGLQENIEIKGEVGREDTLRFIAQSKVLIHPSKYEGFGLVILEALASRTKVLATKVGVAPEIPEVTLIKNDLEKDVDALLNLLKGELKNPVLYPIAQTVERYIRVYDNIRS